MTKEQFYSDLGEVYEIISKKQDEINAYYLVLEDEESEKLEFIDSFLKRIDVEISKQNRLAAINRLVTLREDMLLQILKKSGFDEEEVIKRKEEAYNWVAEFHLKRHEEIIKEIHDRELLTPFYRKIFEGVHEVGKEFSSWQTSWTAHIIDGVNRELYRYFNGDEEKIYEMLHYKDLFDKDSKGNRGDRSYSVLVKVADGEYKSVPYAEAFATEVTNTILALAYFKNDLLKLEDEVFGQHEAYTDYLQAIIEALSETDTTMTIPAWAEVDRRWMRVTAPLQIGHPLEYYEDKYKKAVALEWDLRIVNPNSTASQVKEHIKATYERLFDELDGDRKIYERTLANAERTQLYLGRPALYYGAEFCGLFSAQVVPNDEEVSEGMGKKIFAFADNVLESVRAKPFMKIESQVYEREFLDRSRRFIFGDSKKWHEVYNATTIGHEFGHILWLDSDTESIMNKTGNFKNIEEFKATVGGLVAYFQEGDEDIKLDVLGDTIRRAVGLIAWRESGEVEPYYCEGLIHLHGLFKSGVLEFTTKLKVDMSDEAYERIKAWYEQTYKALALHYLAKRDATKFLERYAVKEGKYYMPKDEKVKYFVQYYWNLYQDIGQVVDDEVSKEKYLEG